MFKAISNFWIENTIGDKLYLIMAVIACGLIVYYLYFKVTNSPKRKIKFIEDAKKQANLGIRPINIFDDLCLNLIK